MTILMLANLGSLKGSSTTYCLLDLIHNWLSDLDNAGCYLRHSKRGDDTRTPAILVCRVLSYLADIVQKRTTVIE